MQGTELSDQSDAEQRRSCRHCQVSSLEIFLVEWSLRSVVSNGNPKAKLLRISISNPSISFPSFDGMANSRHSISVQFLPSKPHGVCLCIVAGPENLLWGKVL